MSLLCLWQSFHRILRYFLFFVIFSLRNCQLANIADHLCVEIGLLQIDQNRQNDIGGMSQKSKKELKEKRLKDESGYSETSPERSLKIEKGPDRCGTMYIPTALRPVGNPSGQRKGLAVHKFPPFSTEMELPFSFSMRFLY